MIFLIFAMTLSAEGFDQAAVKKYCLGCHNAKLKSGGLALESVPDIQTRLRKW